MGFCRINLFKRLESSGLAFEQSIDRHVLRNFVFLHAIKNDQPIPIGAQDAALLDANSYDEDIEGADTDVDLFDPEEEAPLIPSAHGDQAQIMRNAQRSLQHLHQLENASAGCDPTSLSLR
jgi:hypothetical protein